MVLEARRRGIPVIDIEWVLSSLCAGVWQASEDYTLTSHDGSNRWDVEAQVIKASALCGQSSRKRAQ